MSSETVVVELTREEAESKLPGAMAFKGLTFEQRMALEDSADAKLRAALASDSQGGEAMGTVVYIREQEGNETELFATVEEAMSAGSEASPESDWRGEESDPETGLTTQWIYKPEGWPEIRITEAPSPVPIQPEQGGEAGDWPAEIYASRVPGAPVAAATENPVLADAEREAGCEVAAYVRADPTPTQQPLSVEDRERLEEIARIVGDYAPESRADDDAAFLRNLTSAPPEVSGEGAKIPRLCECGHEWMRHGRNYGCADCPCGAFRPASPPEPPVPGETGKRWTIHRLGYRGGPLSPDSWHMGCVPREMPRRGTEEEVEVMPVSEHEAVVERLRESAKLALAEEQRLSVAAEKRANDLQARLGEVEAERDKARAEEPLRDRRRCGGDGGWDSLDARERGLQAGAAGHSEAAAGRAECPGCPDCQPQPGSGGEVRFDLPERLRTDDLGADLADELRTAATHTREEAQDDDVEKEMSEQTREAYNRAAMLDEAVEVVEWAGDQVDALGHCPSCQPPASTEGDQ